MDASQAALAKARDELAGARFEVQLLEADMLAYLRETSGPGAKPFDVILASYAVHHLPTLEKHGVFRLACGTLSTRSSLLFADIVRQDSESREEYLECYVGMLRRAWTGMPPEGLASTIEHVTHRDFPETSEALSAMAREAGLTQEPQELVRDATGFHRLMAFTKGQASVSPSQPTAEHRFKLQSVAFFGRTLAEYLRMFALDLDELPGLKILDVASGPGSFVAEALARGLDATGCDPMYAQDGATIAAQGKADIDSCREQIRRNPGVLVYKDIDAFYREKYAALENFATDFRHRGGDGRYVAGALPALPFDDGAFDLVLSANFLMVYAPLADGGMHDGSEFGLEFHRRAFRELARVTRRELRVAGMHTWTQHPQPHPYAEPMVAVLEELGFAVELAPSDYDDGCQTGDREGEPMNGVLVARAAMGDR